MLQQTTVATVRPRFEAFVARWPDFARFAAADDAEVMAAWAGLGYYARARNLLACARVVAAGAWRPASRHRGSAAPLARDRRLYRSRDRRDRVRPACGGGRQQCRTGRRAAVRAGDAAASRQDGNSRTDGRDHARRARRRFRAGDDGSGVKHLHAAPTALPALPAAFRIVRRSRRGDPEAFPGQAREARQAAAIRHDLLARACAGEVLLVRRPAKGSAGRHARAAHRPVDRLRRPERCGSAGRTPTGGWLDARVSHVFTHFRLELALAVAHGGGHSTARRVVADSRSRHGGPADRLRQGGASDGERTMRATRKLILAGAGVALLSTSGFVCPAAPQPRPIPAPTLAHPLPHVQALYDGYVASGTRCPASSARSVSATCRRCSFPPARLPMTPNARAAGPDTLWRVYSMTKPITAMAAMILIEDGKLKLDQPGERFHSRLQAHDRADRSRTTASPRGPPKARSRSAS